MNFLFVLDYFIPSKGGVEKVFENIILDLEKKGHNIKVLTSHFDKKLPKYEKIGNIEVFRIGKGRFFFTLFASLFGLKLIKNIDILHASTYNAAYVAKFLSFFTKAKFIITSHEILGQAWYDFKGWKGYFYKKIEDIIYSFGAFYVFVTNHVKNVALVSYNLDLLKVKTIYNGIGDIKIREKITKESLGFKKDDIIGIFAGRPGWTKGLDFLLDNYKNIKKINPNFKLLLLILEKENKEKINYILGKIENFDEIKVIYEVNHKNIYKYIDMADIGIVCSRTEGFGLSALEYSMMGKKGVFSFVGGIPEVNFGDIHFFYPEDKTGFLKAFEGIFNGKVNNYGYDKKLTNKKMIVEYEKLYENF